MVDTHLAAGAALVNDPPLLSFKVQEFIVRVRSTLAVWGDDLDVPRVLAEEEDGCWRVCKCGGDGVLGRIVDQQHGSDLPHHLVFGPLLVAHHCALGRVALVLGWRGGDEVVECACEVEFLEDWKKSQQELLVVHCTLIRTIRQMRLQPLLRPLALRLATRSNDNKRIPAALEFQQRLARAGDGDGKVHQSVAVELGLGSQVSITIPRTEPK
jgi:hypothetical protein